MYYTYLGGFAQALPWVCDNIPPMSSLVRLLTIIGLAAVVSAEPAKVAGKWNVTLQLESITGHPVITLKQDGEKLTGTYEGRYGVSDLKGSIKDNVITTCRL